ncbi:MAG: MOSC N-terminal beta barrel domain-containing protein [Polyangiaceae bacterium]|nr:MOSC N-terminal beta barrel domain-containing protein [Polyangiaceae bacterium]
MQVQGSVRELWRFPVKSMEGERVERVRVGSSGIEGDRLWAVRDVRAGTITGAKRLPALLRCRARFTHEPARGEIPPVVVRLPGGEELESGDPELHRQLSELGGREVRLSALPSAAVRAHFRAQQATRAELRRIFDLGAAEPLPDLSAFPLGKLLELARYAAPPGTYVDAYPLHVVTTATLRELAARSGVEVSTVRLRPTLLLEVSGSGYAEAGWTRGSLQCGALVARFEMATVRCGMPAREQAGLPADRRVSAAIARHADRCVGAYASVVHPGTLTVGDAVRIGVPSPSSLERATARATRALVRSALRLLERALPAGRE